MHPTATVEDVESVIGTPPRPILMKVTRTLDDGCRRILDAAPVAALGYRTPDGTLHTEFVRLGTGLARVETETRLSLAVPASAPRPVGSVSLLVLLPGVGETLRLSGRSVGLQGDRLTIELVDAFVHCGRAVLRSGLWSSRPAPPAPTSRPPVAGDGPLADPAVQEFLATSPFLVISTQGPTHRADSSPRGDRPGFARPLDARTLALPDRQGNRRADTLRNLAGCDQVSLACLIPGQDRVLHVVGQAGMSLDGDLLAGMALRRPPHAAVVVDVDRADIRAGEAVRALWGPPVDHPPDLNRIATAHIAANEEAGAITRAVARGLDQAGGLAGRAVRAGLRRTVRDEGFDDA